MSFFFIFLFGMLYILTRLFVEKGAVKAYETRWDRVQAEQKRLTNLYGITVNEYEMYTQTIMDGKHYDEICEKFADDFRYVFGEQWKDILDIPPKPTYKTERGRFPITNHTICRQNNHTFWVYHLLLASKGKLNSIMLNTNVISRGFYDGEMARKFVHCIERRLESNGVPVKFVPHKSSEYSSSYLVIDSTIF